MNLAWSVLADGVNLSSDGKLNVLGRFSRLNVGGLPARHPTMTLALEFESDPLTDVGVSRHLHIALVDPDGRELKTIDADVNVSDPFDAGPMVTLFIIEVRDVEVRVIGSHEFRTQIDGIAQRPTTFFVAQVPQQGAAQ